jgi:SAM-dependent methyltransferase
MIPRNSKKPAVASCVVLIRTNTTKRIVKSIVPPQYRWKLRVWAARAAHAGTRRYCPCCDSHVRGFEAFGERARPEALCPVCGALERHRLVSIFLRNRRDLLLKTKRILHVAPEPPVANVLRHFAQESYVSMDIRQSAMMRADITGMPFRAQTFDGVCCIHVLEHIPDDQQAIRELHRVLRPGGWAVLQVPIEREVTFEDPTITNPNLRRRLFGQPDHVRVYGRDFKDRLAAARFSVSVERPQRRLDRNAVARCGLKTVEDIFLCRKMR